MFNDFMQFQFKMKRNESKQDEECKQMPNGISNENDAANDSVSIQTSMNTTHSHFHAIIKCIKD